MATAIERTRATFSLAPHFRRFLQNIQPPEERKDAAKKYPSLVREFLERTTALKTVDPHSRLTGAYGRRIAIHGIKDVDILIVIDEEYLKLGALAALQDLKSALELLADELAEELGARPEVELREQRRSVRVYFVDPDFYLDVVPVRAPEGVDGVLLVPDREWIDWQPTACIAYGDYFSDLNGQCDDLLVPLMKTMKHWRFMTLKRNQAKSFWVEAMVVHLIVSGKITFDGASLADVVAATFAAIREFCAPTQEDGTTPVVPDPMIPDLNRNVAFNWDRGDFETFMRRIYEALSTSATAVAAQSAAEAVAAWQKLFGENWFPSTVTDEAATAKSVAAASKIGVGVGGAVYIGTPPVAERVVYPKPNLNHGDEPGDA